MIKRREWVPILFLLLLVGKSYAQDKKSFQNFTAAQIVTGSGLSNHEQAAITMLIEEVEKRTLIALPQATEVAAGSVSKIIIGTINSLKQNGKLVSNQVLQTLTRSEKEGYAVKLIKRDRKSVV